ncbi:MAG TPA: phenylalanine--tRNA ligase subunit beta, partial [Blastocatellia bacterium]|nr:phenylalanine--tRNA ligase subunit beta [Blastocatellia bacterium]
ELTLSNPIDETQAQLRTTLLGGVLDAVARNFNHGTRGVRLFEMGKCFSPADGGCPVESELLALAATGARNETDWQRAAERVDFYDLKGAVEAVGEALGLLRFEFEPIETASYLHPGRAAVISLGGKEVGRLGQLHPRVAATYKFKQPVLIAELDFGDLLAADPAEARYSPLAKFPTVVRDLSLLVDEAVTYAAIERAVAALGIPELASVRLFDLYVGRELPAGKHSVALSLRYRAADRTLTEAEISAAHERVTAMLGREFGAQLR